MIKRVVFIVILCAVALGGLGYCYRYVSRQVPRPARPSVVLISIDTVRPDHLGVGGYSKPTSPHLDRLAATGAWFPEARCQAPWTLPSHMSLFTSMLPSHNGVEDIGERLSGEISTLPELLHHGGYYTAAFVNNGQMKPHWGFGRGFIEWHEYEVDQPDGAAPHITDEALRWLQTAPPRPYFLFVHYFDAHDPYRSPPAFRERFGVTQTPSEVSRAVWEYHEPGKEFPDAALLDQVRAAYDAGIAALDTELGRLLAAIPPETLVVVFSDHGEAFKEHGWTTHGASLYEEEIRCALLIRPPRGLPTARRVAYPVMLLDVAPTILGYCGVPVPKHLEGIDLRPALAGKPLPARLQFAETKKVLEGRFLKAIVDPPKKLVYALPDGRREWFMLPDEQRRQPLDSVPAVLTGAIQHWMQEESYWLVRVQGDGRRELAVSVPAGRIGLFIPFGLNFESEPIQLSEDGRSLRWECYPGAGGKCLLLQTDPPEVPLRLETFAGPEGQPGANVQIGTGSNAWERAAQLPVVVAASAGLRDPFVTALAPLPGDGAYVARFQAATPPRRALSPERGTLDEKTMQQLRSLGYVK